MWINIFVITQINIVKFSFEKSLNKCYNTND